MKKNLVTIAALTSILLLTACSATDTSATPPTVNSTSGNAASPPATTTPANPTTPAEFDAIDIKFEEFKEAKPNAPYGIDYSTLGERTIPELGTTLSADQVATATKTMMDTYAKLRTTPEFYKSTRTAATDDAVIQSMTDTIGDFVLRDWNTNRDQGIIFDFVPAFPYVTTTPYARNVPVDETSRYYIDTSKTQTLNFSNLSVEGTQIVDIPEGGIAIQFIDTAEYKLEHGNRSKFNALVKAYVSEVTPGVWKVQGLFWSNAQDKLYDSNDQPLPAVKS